MPKKARINWKEIWKFEYTTKWRDALKANIRDGSFTYHITKSKYVIEDIVIEMICEDMAFKIVNLGAGYKKIYAVDQVCKHCKGVKCG